MAEMAEMAERFLIYYLPVLYNEKKPPNAWRKEWRKEHKKISTLIVTLVFCKFHKKISTLIVTLIFVKIIENPNGWKFPLVEYQDIKEKTITTP